MRIALLLIWLVILICFALSPFEVKAHLHSMGRFHDVYHLIAFGVAAILLAWDSRSITVRLLLGSLAIPLAFGTEFMERYRFHNPFEWHDVYTDCIGILLGLAISAAGSTFLRQARSRYS